MKKNGWILCVCALIVFLTSCAITVNYIGNSYPPTSRVDIYYSKDDVPRPYETMGHADVTGAPLEVSGSTADLEKRRAALEKEAMKRGADAIIIEGIGTSTDVYGYGDSYAGFVSSSEIKLLRTTFIKYK